MANRRQDKLCVDIRVCIDDETDRDIILHQAKVRTEKKLTTYLKKEAASDLFMQLAREKRAKK